MSVLTVQEKVVLSVARVQGEFGPDVETTGSRGAIPEQSLWRRTISLEAQHPCSMVGCREAN